MQKKIIYTDLDGTLTLKDTYTVLLMKQISFKNIFLNAFVLLKSIILYVCKVYNQDDMKKITFSIFFKNKSLSSLSNHIKDLVSNIKINQKVLDQIKTLQKDGYLVVLVTASPDFYVQYICDYFKFDAFISSKTQIVNNCLTGEFNGKICNFDEKVSRIKNDSFYCSDSYKISFGNSKGDHSMLNFCDESYWVSNYNIDRITDENFSSK